jgi:hypothetical protein
LKILKWKELMVKNRKIPCFPSATSSTGPWIEALFGHALWRGFPCTGHIYSSFPAASHSEVRRFEERVLNIVGS